MILFDIGVIFRVDQQNPIALYFSDILDSFDKVRNVEVMTLRTMAGEIDYAGLFLRLRDYPILKENEAQGGYVVRPFNGLRRTTQALVFNLKHKDPVKREILRDIRFRQAMSVAINRDEINEVIHLGKAVPAQATTDPGCTFFEPWMAEYYAEYDPEKANALLDEMGLKWDQNHQYRLQPDGKQLAIAMEFVNMMDYAKNLELIRDYWEKVGVRVDLKEDQSSLYFKRGSANELDVVNWGYGNSSEIAMRCNDANHYRDPWMIGEPKWWNWTISNGERGEEPPETVKRLHETVLLWQQSLPGTEDYARLGREILKINVENLYVIGDVTMGLQPVVFKKNLRNTAQEGPFAYDHRFWMIYYADQWFFEE